MGTNLLAYGQQGVPEAVIDAHDELRAALAKASAEPGPVGVAAKRLALLCVPPPPSVLIVPHQPHGWLFRLRFRLHQ